MNHTREEKPPDKPAGPAGLVRALARTLACAISLLFWQATARILRRPGKKAEDKASRLKTKIRAEIARIAAEQAAAADTEAADLAQENHTKLAALRKAARAEIARIAALKPKERAEHKRRLRAELEAFVREGETLASALGLQPIVRTKLARDVELLSNASIWNLRDGICNRYCDPLQKGDLAAAVKAFKCELLPNGKIRIPKGKASRVAQWTHSEKYF